MSHAVQLPALDGRDPLGFLAAVGLTTLIPDARLSFGRHDATATLHSVLSTRDDIARALTDIVKSIPDDATLPAVPAAFPMYRKGNTGGDPMRMSRTQYRDYADTHPQTHAWLQATLTDLALDKQQRASLTHYMAPSGKQSIGTFFSTPLNAVRDNPTHLHEAITAWRRIDNFSGEYLDHRVLSSAADHPTGKSTESGVPGATWLATQALALTRTTATSSHPQTSGWHYHRRTQTTYLIWPLWNNPLTPSAIQILIEHPILVPDPDQLELTLPVHPSQLNELGIFYANAARRQPVDNRKFAGVLTPHPITVKASTPRRTEATIL